MKRAATIGAVLVGDLLLLWLTWSLAGQVRSLGGEQFCDGYTVWCDGRGDVTHAEWLELMNFRSGVVHGLSAAVAFILLVIAAVAWRHRRRGIAFAQVLPLLLVAVFAVAWKPYMSV
ncbi:hypothetical protein Sme01_18850 [Sphaerisporangium melleum]|uniref:Uncharacterized protein n=2 Tax=Sphaerisporangium melleum TaxID=321316 RepID=A0A917RRR7_9ACTN|nr:hypothetical protein GCM10007964_74640 [Sphaerisporangium melleum]GII69409.1 hypothetical protein Sme01_18850 [Sphaerisporangium melleum]